MQALMFDGSLRVVECATPSPGPSEARVRVALAGVCGTDLAITGGYAGFHGILGHELVGRVDSGAPRWQGRRVVAEINVGCGECGSCRAGVRGHCPTREVIGIRGRDGCFATHVIVPEANLHAVPDGLADEVAVFVEPVAAALRIAEQLELGPATPVVVVGDGRLGLLIAMVLGARGCPVTVVGRTARKLEIARGFGARAVLGGELSSRAHAIVVDATGSRDGFDLALGLVARRGTLVLKSSLRDAVPLSTTAIVVDEITIVGSRCGPFADAIALLGSGAIDPRVLIEHVVPLCRADEALALAASRGVLKVLIDARDDPR